MADSMADLLKGLSKRVEALEARVAELEGCLTESGGQPDCEYCGKGEMRKVASEPSEDKPDLAVRLETWMCQACGEIDHRVEPPR